MQAFRVPVEVMSRPRAGPRSIAVAIAVGVTTAALLVVLPGAAGTDRQPIKRGQSKPNIVVITTDDQNLKPLDTVVMPNVTALLRAGGTRFTEAIVTTPLCCPSRASMLTGQYAHNHGVTWNTPGYPTLVGKGNTLPVWLRRAGYHTAHVGKYLNGYERFVDDPAEVPPGWQEWHSVLDPTYYDYQLYVNGSSVAHGGGDEDYLTHVLNDRATALIHRYVPEGKPLYLQVDQFAPHGTSSARGSACRGSAIPAPGDEDLFASLPFPQSASFNEENVSDKPSFMRRLPRLSGADRVKARSPASRAARAAG